jgi:hypothetical protein
MNQTVGAIMMQCTTMGGWTVECAIFEHWRIGLLSKRWASQSGHYNKQLGGDSRYLVHKASWKYWQ